jgi:hypothetical protein
LLTADFKSTIDNRQSSIVNLQALCRQEVNLAEFYTLDAYEHIGHPVYFADLSFEHYYLEAIVMAEVNVQRGNCFEQVRMLQIGQAFHNSRGVMVIYEDDGSDCLGFVVTKALTAQLQAY